MRCKIDLHMINDSQFIRSFGVQERTRHEFRALVSRETRSLIETNKKLRSHSNSDTAYHTTYSYNGRTHRCMQNKLNSNNNNKKKKKNRVKRDCDDDDEKSKLGSRHISLTKDTTVTCALHWFNVSFSFIKQKTCKWLFFCSFAFSHFLSRFNRRCLRYAYPRSNTSVGKALVSESIDFSFLLKMSCSRSSAVTSDFA